MPFEPNSRKAPVPVIRAANVLIIPWALAVARMEPPTEPTVIVRVLLIVTVEPNDTLPPSRTMPLLSAAPVPPSCRSLVNDKFPPISKFQFPTNALPVP